MKNLNFSICKDIQIAKTKSIEFQVDGGYRNNMASEWFEFVLKSRSRQDHWGVEFRITLLNIICLMIDLYDHRHYEETTE